MFVFFALFELVRFASIILGTSDRCIRFRRRVAGGDVEVRKVVVSM